MCFMATVKDTKALAKRMRQAGGTMKFYKAVDGDRTPVLYYSGITYTRGTVVRADKKRQRVKKRSRTMTNGIYTFLRRVDATGFFGSDKVIAVEAQIKDLVGADDCQAVFHKVKVLT